MKNILLLYIVANFLNICFAQNLVVHKTDGSTHEFPISEINKITFSMQVSTEQLAAWYPFNSNFNDSTGNGYNGTNHGVVFVADRFLSPGKAAHFSGGSSSYITTSNTGNLALNDSFSVCFWMKFENGGVIIEKDIAGTVNTDWHIRCDALGKIGINLGTSATAWTDSNINDNEWHLVVFLRNRSNGTLRMYIDAQLDREVTGQTQNLTGTANINIGAWENPTSFAEGFTGSLDDIRFYKRELTESEIQLLYQGS